MTARVIAGRTCAHCGSRADGALFPNEVVRFLRNVQTGDGCWNWTGNTDPAGYGRVGLTGGVYLAHRVSYEHFVGPVPVEMHLDHLCRNKACVRPDHLEVVTPTINTRRSKKATCPRGHVLAGDNLLAYPRRHGRRSCKACQRDYLHRRSAVEAAN